MGFETFERDIKLATAGLESAAIDAALARFARQELRRVIATGEASETYDRYVNGVKGAPEESVRAPGPILYEFTNWPRVIRMALDLLVKNSPKRTGKYAAGFMVLANQRPVRGFGEIEGNAEVVVFNVRPYTRKIEVGAMKMSVPPRHFDKTKAAMARQFGRDQFRFEVKFLKVGSGLHPDVPYRLRRSRKGRKDSQAGSTITYPSLIINRVH